LKGGKKREIKMWIKWGIKIRRKKKYSIKLKQIKLTLHKEVMVNYNLESIWIKQKNPNIDKY
jgi:hypothetical protein